MHRHAVMHDSILQKMPKTESSVIMMKSQEVSGQFYSNFFFTVAILKKCGQICPPPGTDRVNLTYLYLSYTKTFWFGYKIILMRAPKVQVQVIWILAKIN